MSQVRGTTPRFEEIDTNQDGVIDKQEFRSWASKDEGYVTASHASTYVDGSWTPSNNDNSYHIVPYSTNTTSSGLSDLTTNEIQTKSQEETDRYLGKQASIYRDPNPQIIRRAAIDGPRTYEQRIMVRYFQPPELPPPGPLIIQQQYGKPPAPPSRLVIIERPPSPPTPPPLILRERPPTPPPEIPQEIRTMVVPHPPAPPSSVIIKRFSRAPEKPRDIIIERWLPYGAQPPRQTIVRPPTTPPTKYPEPRNIVEIYEAVQIRTVRKLHKSAPIRENPYDYVARHEGSMLDSTRLLHEARRMGVYEDLSPPGH